MCPEQAAGESVDPRGDIYSLGAVAFFLLTGRPPFEASSVGKLITAHLTQICARGKFFARKCLPTLPLSSRSASRKTQRTAFKARWNWNPLLPPVRALPTGLLRQRHSGGNPSMCQWLLPCLPARLT